MVSAIKLEWNWAGTGWPWLRSLFLSTGLNVSRLVTATSFSLENWGHPILTHLLPWPQTNSQLQMPLNLHLHELQRISMRSICIPHSCRNPRTIWSVSSGAVPPFLEMCSFIPLPLKSKGKGGSILVYLLTFCKYYTCDKVDLNCLCENE